MYNYPSKLFAWVDPGILETDSNLFLCNVCLYRGREWGGGGGIAFVLHMFSSNIFSNFPMKKIILAQKEFK